MSELPSVVLVDDDQPDVLEDVAGSSPTVILDDALPDPDVITSDMGPAGPPGPAGPAGSDADATALVESHVAATLPHPAYDDMPSLTLLFENGLI